jgi:hypothetical protein
MSNFSGEKLDEAQTYLTTQRIPEIMQSIAASLLVERPEDPRKFIAKQLQMMRSVKVIFPNQARNQNHVIFTKENFTALFRCFDNVGRGYISGEQYGQGY